MSDFYDIPTHLETLPTMDARQAEKKKKKSRLEDVLSMYPGASRLAQTAGYGSGPSQGGGSKATRLASVLMKAFGG